MIFDSGSQHHTRRGKNWGPEAGSKGKERVVKVECIERVQRLANRAGNWHNGESQSGMHGVQGLRREKRRRRRGSAMCAFEGGWHAKSDCWVMTASRGGQAAVVDARQGD